MLMSDPLIQPTEVNSIGLSTVYGPVRSWRVGRSLGIDLLSANSICSFRCIYCQLGSINVHTCERRIFVPTSQVLGDLQASRWQDADIITLSGSGEPTLAANIGEVIQRIKLITGKPVLVLTNATLLNDPAVRRDLSAADKVFCKLDAADERTFKMIARPVPGLTLSSIVAGIRRFRKEYDGYLAVQVMLMPLHRRQETAFADMLNEIRPDEVQLNSPLRPIPRTWMPKARGNIGSILVESVHARTLAREEFERFELRLHQLTGLKIVSAPWPGQNRDQVTAC
jgi:wyosine [tRNA(Phe)-imidazoG37] synthetase (radical SAM superfamily)